MEIVLRRSDGWEKAVDFNNAPLDSVDVYVLETPLTVITFHYLGVMTRDGLPLYEQVSERMQPHR